MSFEKLNGKNVLKIKADTTIKGTDEATIVKIKNSKVKNGTTEVKLLNHLQQNAPVWARGFIFIASRIESKTVKFENWLYYFQFLEIIKPLPEIFNNIY